MESLRDSYTKLKKLSMEKNLLEREKLQKKVEDLQDVIKEQEEKIQVFLFIYIYFFLKSVTFKKLATPYC